MKTKNPKKVDLKQLFGSLQNQMLVQLNTNREFIDHPGSKGDSLENVWIEWLRTYLPSRYCVDKAIIVDCTGQISHQIDMVIYDRQFTPFVFSQNGIHYIPAEGVYAIFEIKPDIKGDVDGLNYIAYAGAKIESVRVLKRTSTNIIDRGKSQPARSLTKIIGGILTSTSSYSGHKTIIKHLKALTNLKTIDMGCIVDVGSFYVDYKGEEDSEMRDSTNRINDYYKRRAVEKVEFSNSETSLISFFLQLSRYLQQSIGTVAAIDFNEYAKAIKFSIDDSI